MTRAQLLRIGHPEVEQFGMRYLETMAAGSGGRFEASDIAQKIAEGIDPNEAFVEKFKSQR